jgi:dihydroorotase/N-acyl-D-amino-acid deacylase
VYATHLRNEGPRIAAAIAEALRIGREAGLPVHIWHLKLSGQSSWGRMPQVLALLDSARTAGADVGADSYPYTASATSLASLTPAWAQEGGDSALVRRLGEPATRARMRREMARRGRSVGGVMVLGVHDTALVAFEGRLLRDIARERRRDVYEALFDLLAADSARTGAAFFSMSEADVRAAVAAPWLGVCTDFGAVAPDGLLGYRTVHPRAYGSFPRILGRYVRDERLLTLEAAVRKMTGVAADRFRLAERGYLRPGYFADVTVFDPERVADRATFAQAATADGIRYVLVNGRFTLDDGRLTGQRPGRPLRGPGWRPS